MPHMQLVTSPVPGEVAPGGQEVHVASAVLVWLTVQLVTNPRVIRLFPFSELLLLLKRKKDEGRG